jgi:hypothetical protein
MGRARQDRKGTVKRADLNGFGGVRGRVKPKTQVQKPNLGHPPRRFGLWVGEVTYPGHPPN